MFRKLILNTLFFLLIGGPMLEANATNSQYDTAIFAGGCFWCMTPPFEKLNGVVSVISGYIGGTAKNPTYEDYAEKGYIEAIKVTFMPQQVSYLKLLEVFWKQINPTDAGGQFCDRGAQYRAAVFYSTAEQKQLAEKSKAELEKSGKFLGSIVTEIIPATTFYPAEAYHQDYYKKNPVRYHFYRYKCGRDQYLEKIWGKPAATDPVSKQSNFIKPSKAELKKMLTPMQYKVTQEHGTEPPFQNEYWDNHQEGIYVDIVSGEPLFSSNDKFDSGTGWPSFTKPLDPNNVVENKSVLSYITGGIEVKSKLAGSHLGDIFNDGPPPTHLRYCIDSAALRFIPKSDLEKEGYGQYLQLFSSANKN